MTASDADEMEQEPGLAMPDFDQALAGMASVGFSEGDKTEGFSGLMPSDAEETAGMDDAAEPADNSAMIAGLPVMMKVVLGSAKMPVATLAKLAKGSIVKLDKMVGDPVDILVNGRLIARGEVVVLNESASRFGVVLTQVGNLAASGK
ncbi:MAG TPA: FliM/FliN family flagellar motor switch protein [Hyphomicrobium sp.]|jgi:flagellar motor switch protein FliN/FliY